MARRMGLVRMVQLSPEEVDLELTKVNEALPENKILLISVLNALHPITVDVLHKVCSTPGNVEKIVIFDKGSLVQAMVEFDHLDSALKAKKTLHGCDIYPDCCTLRVEFGRQEKLNVKANTMYTWDYTAAPGGPPSISSGPPARRKVLLTEGPPGVQPRPIANGNPTPLLELQTRGYHGSNGSNGGYNGGVSQSMGGGTFRTMGGYQGSYEPDERMMGPVMMVYSLDPEKFNCQKLFNLLCLYGNVVKINFLKSKEGVAMVEFDDGLSVDRACRNLSQTKVFGARLRLEPSRKERVEDIRKPHELLDGTDSFESFFRDRNNRFDTPERAAKNRVMPPTNVLHFYNTPLLSEDQMADLFVDHDAPCPSNVRWFDLRREGSRTGSGMIEFETVEDAVEALVLVNNLRVEGVQGEAEGMEFDIKLCFSRTFM